MEAAIVAFMTMTGGPVGTFAGAIAGGIGFAGMSGLCYLVIQAVTTNKSLVIDFWFNGIFPNASVGLE